MANGRPAGEQDDMEASVAMADSLAEGVPDVCRSLADDERIRSRRQNGPAYCLPVLCERPSGLFPIVIGKYLLLGYFTDLRQLGKYSLARLGSCPCRELHCTSTGCRGPVHASLATAVARLFGFRTHMQGHAAGS